MSLLSRVVEHETCRVQGCTRKRAQDSDCCDVDTVAKWHNGLDRQPDGTFTRRRSLPARDLTNRMVAA